jgi:hypothetical protein
MGISGTGYCEEDDDEWSLYISALFSDDTLCRFIAHTRPTNNGYENLIMKASVRKSK